MVGLYVRGDRRVEHLCAWISGLQALAKIGGGDIFVHGLQQVNADPLMRRQVQRIEVRQRKAGPSPAFSLERG